MSKTPAAKLPPVSTTLAANLTLVSTTLAANFVTSFFCLFCWFRWKICHLCHWYRWCNLPPVSTTPAANLPAVSMTPVAMGSYSVFWNVQISKVNLKGIRSWGRMQTYCYFSHLFSSKLLGKWQWRHHTSEEHFEQLKIRSGFFIKYLRGRTVSKSSLWKFGQFSFYFSKPNQVFSVCLPGPSWTFLTFLFQSLHLFNKQTNLAKCKQ